VRRVVASFVMVVLVLAAAGCGGGGDDGRKAYVEELNRAQAQLTQRFEAIQSRLPPTSTPAQNARTLRDYEAVVDRTVADLRRIDPPDGFAALHRRYIAQVAAYGAAVRSARELLGGRDPRQLLAAQASLKASILRTGRRIDATFRAINAKLRAS
jgi:hypothetical protein